MGVKAELGEPDPARPDEGRLHFQVEWYLCVSLCVLEIVFVSICAYVCVSESVDV